MTGVQATNPRSHVPADPYQLTEQGVMEPPRGWRQSLRYLGPGLVTSAAVVGSGELIATTALGAEVGFALLWLVVFSTAVKVAIQVELARWTIVTGKPALTGYNQVRPRLGRIGWVNWVWLIMSLAKALQAGGIIGGMAIALSMLVPLNGEPLSATSTTIWTVILVVASIATLYTNRYSLIERGAFVLVVCFTGLTVAIALGLPLTPFAYDAGDIIGGLNPTIPAGTLGVAIAMFGLTGVAADEMTSYTYWCAEKGYARWTGPADGSEAWARRARGWLKVMYRDAFVSWVVYTTSTLSFFVVGAAVLHPQGLVPEGSELVQTLSRVYTDTLGEWASTAFLIAALAVLGSTLWAAVPALARAYCNFLSEAGVFDWSDVRQRNRWLRVFTVLLPTVWGSAYLFVASPVLMVQIGGIMTGIFLLAVVVAVWCLRREVDPRVRGGRIFFCALWLSSAAVAVLGVYTVLTVFGVEIG